MFERKKIRPSQRRGGRSVSRPLHSSDHPDFTECCSACSSDTNKLAALAKIQYIGKTSYLACFLILYVKADFCISGP